jgi:hypothetical protein
MGSPWGPARWRERAIMSFKVGSSERACAGSSQAFSTSWRCVSPDSTGSSRYFGLAADSRSRPRHHLQNEGTPDSPWHGALDYFAARRLQFGKEVDFTFGPLGYVYSMLYSGYLLDLEVIRQLQTKAVFATLAIIVIQHSGKMLGELFGLNTLLFSPVLAFLVDPLFLFAIILLLSLLVPYEGHPLLFFRHLNFSCVPFTH